MKHKLITTLVILGKAIIVGISAIVILLVFLVGVNPSSDSNRIVTNQHTDLCDDPNYYDFNSKECRDRRIYKDPLFLSWIAGLVVALIAFGFLVTGSKDHQWRSSEEASEYWNTHDK